MSELCQYRLGYSVSNKSLGLTSGNLIFGSKPLSYLSRRFRTNLDSLLEILAWNEAAGIRMFRVSSNIIPNLFRDLDVAEAKDMVESNLDKIYAISDLIRSAKMRITCHAPHTLGSRLELERYYVLADLLFKLNNDKIGSLIFHIGTQSTKVPWERNIEENLKYLQRLCVDIFLENADTWSINETVAFAGSHGCGIVYDIFHHKVYCETIDGIFSDNTIQRAILDCISRTPLSQNPKFHISSQAINCAAGTHAGTIDYTDYIRLRILMYDLNIPSADIMIEAGGKELAVQNVMQKTSQLRPPWSKVNIVGLRI